MLWAMNFSFLVGNKILYIYFVIFTRLTMVLCLSLIFYLNYQKFYFTFRNFEWLKRTLSYIVPLEWYSMTFSFIIFASAITANLVVYSFKLSKKFKSYGYFVSWKHEQAFLRADKTASFTKPRLLSWQSIARILCMLQWIWIYWYISK